MRRANPDDDFALTDVMIPMRDSVELRTLILSPKTMGVPLPMLLSRTPYDASKSLRVKQRTALHSVLGPAVDGHAAIVLAHVFDQPVDRIPGVGGFVG